MNHIAKSLIQKQKLIKYLKKQNTILLEKDSLSDERSPNMLKSLEILAEVLKNAVLAELEAQENGATRNILLDKSTKGSIACSGGKNDKTA